MNNPGRIVCCSGLLAACIFTVVGVCAAQATSTVSWDQIGAKAGADDTGDGLSMTATNRSVRLRCVFQKLDGEATSKGLWLNSTVSNAANHRFRVVAASVQSVSRVTPPNDACVGSTVILPQTGTVEVADKLVRFIRPGLIEEYSVSMDGVRQDFVVLERPARGPAGEGALCVHLALSGARAEQTPYGVELVLEKSQRRIAYSRLHVADANGKKLTARIEVSANAGTRSLGVVVDDTAAVYPVRIDPTFSDANWISMGGLSGTDGVVRASVVDDSGNLYIGGDFTIVGDTLANRIAKWNGSGWSALGSGMNSNVSSLAVSGSGDLYVGGTFTTAGGIAASKIAKWNGSTWSALGAGMNSNVAALAVSGSDVYAGGGFTMAGGTAANYIAKWNGSTWLALGSGVNGPFAPGVTALAMSGSDLYAGGTFTTAGGTAANYIAKWNGSSWSALGSGLNLFVSTLAISGTDLYVGGIFSTAGGSPANYIAKWNGSSWSALGSGANSSVLALVVSGSNVYAGGAFDVPANRVAKWNGSSWSALGSGVNSTVFALAASGSNLYVGGEFRSAGGVAAKRLAKWNGSNWSTVNSNLIAMDGPVQALAILGADLYAGGHFTAAGRTLAHRVAKWNGSSWSALGSGMNYGVFALATLGSDLYAGGAFTTAGGTEARCIGKWNGSNWSALGSGVVFDESRDTAVILALAAAGSNLYAGGGFTSAGGIAANSIAKWNGTSWSALGSGINGVVQELPAVQALAASGTNLYAGGWFTNAGGIAASSVAKWNGNSWSALGSGINGIVFALAVSGTNLYVGGRFTTAGGITATNIAKWNGSSWSTMGSGWEGGNVTALAVSGTNVYATGGLDGKPTFRIANWDGSRWSSLGSATDFGVAALAVAGDQIYAGGDFMMAGGKVSAFVARGRLSFTPDNLALTANLPGPHTTTLTFAGVPGFPYVVQYATNLSGSPWFTLSTNAPAANGVGTALDPAATDAHRFYRVGFQE